LSVPDHRLDYKRIVLTCANKFSRFQFTLSNQVVGEFIAQPLESKCLAFGWRV
jgi:hypothetical protein